MPSKLTAAVMDALKQNTRDPHTGFWMKHAEDVGEGFETLKSHDEL